MNALASTNRIDGRVSAGWFLGLSALLLLIMSLSALGLGAMPVGWRELLALAGRPFGLDADVSEQTKAVLFYIRLPRVVLAVLAGAGLAVGGAALQALFRNPLADPGVLGISSGAALGAGAMIVLGSNWETASNGALAGFAVPLAAFAGALAAAGTVWRLSIGGEHDAASTLLAGIAVNALAGAGIGLLSWLADDAALRNFTFWTLGSLASAGWEMLVPVILLVIPALLRLQRQAQALNLLLLGETEAGHLGVDTRRLKAEVIGLATLTVGALVAVTGVIGFLGLAAPHLARLCIGPDHRRLLPGAALAGALLLQGADLCARTWAAPAELPIGLLTALLGGPFFLWLLRRHAGGREC
jgi:iron complex transport system permease protein